MRSTRRMSSWEPLCEARMLIPEVCGHVPRLWEGTLTKEHRHQADTSWRGKHQPERPRVSGVLTKAWRKAMEVQ